MRAVVQRVTRARVTVDGAEVGAIGPGLLVLLAVAPTDTELEAEWMAGKLAQLRVFADDAGKMNRSVRDIGGSILLVPQFTLYGDARKGNRPAFVGAARPEFAQPMVATVGRLLTARGVPVATGRFGAMMQVELVNDGPVTLVLER